MHFIIGSVATYRFFPIQGVVGMDVISVLMASPMVAAIFSTNHQTNLKIRVAPAFPGIEIFSN